LAFGWLLEHLESEDTFDTQKDSTEGPSKRTTNYVLLWNLSTSPTSLWIVYDFESTDYEILDSEDAVPVNDIVQDHHNKLFWADEGKFRDKVGQPGQDIFGDGIEETSSKHKFIEDYFANAPPDDLLERNGPVGEPSIKTGEPSQVGKHGKNKNKTPAKTGFFGFEKPFDLAMLAPDITKWNVDMGFEADLAKECLAHSRVRLGNTLRARRVKGPRQLNPSVTDIRNFIAKVQPKIDGAPAV